MAIVLTSSVSELFDDSNQPNNSLPTPEVHLQIPTFK